MLFIAAIPGHYFQPEDVFTLQIAGLDIQVSLSVHKLMEHHGPDRAFTGALLPVGVLHSLYCHIQGK